MRRLHLHCTNVLHERIVCCRAIDYTHRLQGLQGNEGCMVPQKTTAHVPGRHQGLRMTDTRPDKKPQAYNFATETKYRTQLTQKAKRLWHLERQQLSEIQTKFIVQRTNS